MITLLELVLENFFAVKSETIVFSHKGVSVITGTNGSSKTTMFVEGPYYALFGSSFEYGDRPGDLVVSRWSKSMSVILTFVANSVTYRVSRYRGHQEHKNKVILEQMATDGWHDISRSSAAATQLFINSILGMDSKVFAHTCIFSDSFGRFPDLPDNEKKALISTILGLDGCDSAHKLTKTKAQALEAELGLATRLLENDARSLEEAQKRMLDLTSREHEFVETSSGRLQELLEQEKRAKLILEEVPVVADLVDTSKAKAKVSSLESFLLDLEKPTPTESSRIKRLITETEGAIQKLKKSSKCGECNRSFDNAAEAEAHVSELEAKLLVLKSNLAVAKEKELEAESDYTELKRNAMESLSKARASLSAVENSNATKIMAEREHKKRLAAVSVRLEEIADQIASLESNPYTELIEKERAAIIIMGEAIAEKTTSVSQLKARLEEERTLLQLFGPKGCKLNLLGSATPAINLTLSNLTSMIDVPLSIELVINQEDEAFSGSVSIVVSNQKGANRYHGSSRGERRLIDILVLLALASSLQSTSSFSQVVFDETFESLHETNQAAVLECVKRIFSDRQLYIISHHHSGLEDIDRVIEVEDGRIKIS